MLIAVEGEPMKLRSNESLVLIIHKTNTGSAKYFVAVRKAENSFDQHSHDFQLNSGQEAVLELGHEPDVLVAIEQAIAKIREFQP
jgi:hypothetical protein